MFCPNCGSKIGLENSNFCSNCGFNLSNISAHNSEIKKPLDKIDANDASKSDPQKRSNLQQIIGDDNGQTNSSEQRPKNSVTTSSPNISTSKLEKTGWENFKDKWGFGWLFFGYQFYSPQTSKVYEKYGDFGSALTLFGFIASMMFYYFFRQKLRGKIKTDWIRSTLSVVIAYIIVTVLSIIVVLLVKP